MSQKGKINNKEKQAVTGNWGHPDKYTKKHTKIPDPLIPEVKHKRKKKKEKRKYISPFDRCPHCDNILPLDPAKIKSNNARLLFWLQPRLEICPSCGAKRVKKPDCCPACKRTDTVWKSTENVYKHQSMSFGCGFVGKKKEK